MFDEKSPMLDIPFDKRNTCWFCGEISFKNLSIKDELLKDINSDYTQVLFPACEECFNLSMKIKHSSIEEIQQSIKDKIVIKYSKYLAIGSKWTAEEIQSSEFSGIALSGFKESAWFMFEQTKSRINYTGWDVSVDGISLGNTSGLNRVKFDGVQYSNLSELLNYLVKTFSIDKNFLRQVIDIYGKENIVQAVKYCRLIIHFDDEERKSALNDLRISKKEEEALLSQDHSILNFSLTKNDVFKCEINKKVIPSDAILWAMRSGIVTLNDLDNNEGEMFQYFEEKGFSDDKIFNYFNSLEIYLDKRNHSPSWRAINDSNIELWEKIIRSVKGNHYFEDNFQLTSDSSKLNNESDDETNDEYLKESLEILLILESIVGVKAIKSGNIISSSQMEEFIFEAEFYDIKDYELFFDSIYGHDYEELLPKDPFLQYKHWKTWPIE
ncbi:MULTISPECIES: hypothetical protein [unclassified Colwellia]|uniref:hypothetical protein n=1 Tax=unclassified Colwellia TaxID=196834 RepID=UPI0015F74929|nr:MULTISPECIES: hypothetical protein [unclassified Colwellia]MBA6358039.1 hypothetical protein [Colwellia sp. BRX8-3]MBA6367559.1 hypothetical protein [Colwellia sp. BRX8-5]MBA6376437.1 hypothetical protein [Colwellia sp. BRX8-2]